MNIICRQKTKEKIVSFTFDDGPDNITTPEILNILTENNITATFFVIGHKAEKNPELIKQIFNHGHIIANHTYCHSNFLTISSVKKYYNDIIKTNEIISNIISKWPLLYRPPFGVTNPNIAKAVKKCNLKSIGWSIRTFDKKKSPEKILQIIKKKINSGDVILFHDTSRNTLNSLNQIINYLNQAGFKIVGLDKLLNIKAYE